MGVKIHDNFEQGSEEWYAARCGLLTASEMGLIITPAKLGAANNDKSRSHLYELLAQRVTKYVEPTYVGDAMLRGKADEIEARAMYEKEYEPVTEVGFITNDRWGFTLGYSPDGLIGEDGTIEIKSRCQKYQMETILSNEMPNDFLLQVQTGLIVSERKWCDFVSYCGGMPMLTLRVYADDAVQSAILDVAAKFEEKLQDKLEQYDAAISAPSSRLIPTERRIEMEMFV